MPLEHSLSQEKNIAPYSYSIHTEKGGEKMKQTTVILGIIGLVLVGGVALMNMNSKDASSEQAAAQTTTPAAVSEESTMNTKTIVDIASEDSNFSTLVAAVKAAGLAETLSGEGPFTVFAPTNEAFAKLPEGTVESLLQDKEKLAVILTYHVVSGKVMAADVTQLPKATTVQGQDVTITAENNAVMVNDATVVQTDIEASNGVIHVIDTVLLPQ